MVLLSTHIGGLDWWQDVLLINRNNWSTGSCAVLHDIAATLGRNPGTAWTSRFEKRLGLQFPNIVSLGGVIHYARDEMNEEITNLSENFGAPWREDIELILNQAEQNLERLGQTCHLNAPAVERALEEQTGSSRSRPTPKSIVRGAATV